MCIIFKCLNYSSVNIDTWFSSIFHSDWIKFTSYENFFITWPEYKSLISKYWSRQEISGKQKKKIFFILFLNYRHEKKKCRNFISKSFVGRKISGKIFIMKI